MNNTTNLSTSARAGAPSPYGLFAVAWLAAIGLTRPALAADAAVTNGTTPLAQTASPISPSSQTGPQQATPPVGGSGSSGGGGQYTINPAPPTPQNPNALADQLKVRGWIFPFPSASDTVDQGAFGLRSKLADLGISWVGFNDTTYEDNILHHGHPPGVNSQVAGNSKQQQYEGQLPTFSGDNAFFINYDLRRYGIPDGQITVGAYLVSTNWNPSGPNGVGVAEASWYQTAFDRKVEIKAGYLSNNLEFLGTQVGGNLASGIFGVSAAIPFENGQNLGGFPSLGVNVKFNLPGFFYDKVGVQRALSPDGVTSERLQNPNGVDFKVDNSGVFVIDEFGYRALAAPGRMGTWIRAAANYTSSRYTDIQTGIRHPTNFGLYFLADRQLIQTAPSPRTAFQGLYAGFTVMDAPSYFNVFSQYYEARLYGFGLIPGRPFDLISLVANRNVYSPDAIHLASSFGLSTHGGADTYTISYSAHVLPGTTLKFGVGYTDNPTVITYNPGGGGVAGTGSALNVWANKFGWFLGKTRRCLSRRY